jgi:two-component system, OmpR family, sensor histidine kinase VicK
LRRLENFDVRYIPANSGIRTKTVITVIVDRKDSLVMELKEPQEVTPFAEAIGLSTYCNSKSSVSSYVSIFESLWNQTELYDKLKNHDMLQQIFINLAAHELRTPTQSILGYIELAKMDSDYNRIDAQKGGIHRYVV